MKKASIGLSLILALSPVLANAEYKAGGYIGGSFGITELDLSSDEKALIAQRGESLDETDTGFKLFSGYRIHDYIAVEAFYANFGEMASKSDSKKTTIEPFSYGLSVLGIFPINESIDIFASAGGYKWEIKRKTIDNLGTSSSREDDTDWKYGVGAAYTIEQLSIRAEYEIYEFDNDDIEMLSLGLSYKI